MNYGKYVRFCIYVLLFRNSFHCYGLVFPNKKCDKFSEQKKKNVLEVLFVTVSDILLMKKSRIKR